MSEKKGVFKSIWEILRDFDSILQIVEWIKFLVRIPTAAPQKATDANAHIYTPLASDNATQIIAQIIPIRSPPDHSRISTSTATDAPEYQPKRSPHSSEAIPGSAENRRKDQAAEHLRNALRLLRSMCFSVQLFYIGSVKSAWWKYDKII